MLIQANVFREGLEIDTKQKLLDELDEVLISGDQDKMLEFIKRYSQCQIIAS